MDISEQYFRIQNPFIDVSISLIQSFIKNQNNYDSNSCTLIKNICHAGMITCDYLNVSQTTSVTFLLNNLWNMFWNSYVAFSSLANTTIGTSLATITSNSRTILDMYTNWDEALQPNPFSNISDSFYTVLKGVNV